MFATVPYYEVEGLPWPDTELGPLCPGMWVEEIGPEDLPGAKFGASAEPWWLDARDKNDELVPHLTGLEALDARLSLEIARTKQAKCEEARIRWSTDKVTRMFSQAQTWEDLKVAFEFLSRVKDRDFIPDSAIRAAKAQITRNEVEARRTQVNNPRELNRQMGDWARSISYRVRLDEGRKPMTQGVRDQSWVLVEMRPGIGAVCRGKDVRERPILMAEPEIFGFMEAQTA